MRPTDSSVAPTRRAQILQDDRPSRLSKACGRAAATHHAEQVTSRRPVQGPPSVLWSGGRAFVVDTAFIDNRLTTFVTDALGPVTRPARREDSDEMCRTVTELLLEVTATAGRSVLPGGPKGARRVRSRRSIVSSVWPMLPTVASVPGPTWHVPWSTRRS